MPPTANEDLRKWVAERRVVVVVGSGVSSAATGGEEVASWAGLLRSGVARCRANDARLDDAWERRTCEQIGSDDLDETLLAAEMVSRKLGAPTGGAFAGWLRETVGGLKIRHRELLDAIRLLEAPLVTTNYDGLLEKATGLPPITWLDEGKVSRLLQRAEDSAAIFHVHGYWDRPESVVLGIRAYQDVSERPHTQAVLRALAMTQSLLFVGCGDGLRDPNFDPFLSWLGTVNRCNETPHYRLALEKDVVNLARQHTPEQRIQIVPYGKQHGDLVGFLEKLASRGRSIRETQQPALAERVGVHVLTPAVAAYLQRLAGRMSTLQLLGLGRGVQITLPIQEAYIPLRTAIAREVEDRRAGHSRDPLVEGAGHCERDIELSRVFEVARQFGHRGALLLGDPGAGKTTGARQVCWRVLHPVEAGDTPGLPAGCVPVFLRLRDLTAELLAKGLQAFIAERVGSDALPKDRAQPAPDLVDRQGVLWVFDGLDEVVSEEARVKVCEWIRRWLEDRTGDFALVTSRYQGYQGRVDLGAEFCRFHVQPLSAEQSEEFVRRWYRAVYRRLHPADHEAATRGAAEAQALLGLLNEPVYRIGGLKELPANPLLLTILCLVHHEDHSLPRKRSEVYARCVRVLLESWRQEARRTQGVASFDAEAAERVLASLAWWLHEEENRTSSRLAELGEKATGALSEVSASSGLGREGEAFVKRMRDESGILAMWGGGQCGFLHLSFQEYLAGLHASREGKAGDLVERMGSSWWREAILVALAVGSRAFAHEFFNTLLQTDPVRWEVSLVDQCLEEASMVPMEPFVAVLKDGKASSARKAAILRRLRTIEHPELTEVCRALAGSGDRELRAIAVEVVQRATGVVVEGVAARTPEDYQSFVDPRSGIAFVALPAGNFEMGSERGRDREKPVHRVRVSAFAMGKYAVTNAEYGRFLEANPDQEPPEYWNQSQWNDPQQPVVGVSWEEAQAFCRWAGARLPTEAQWEYSCRAGTRTEWCFGNEESELEDYAWYDENSGSRTHPVGEKKANGWGLCDMHGNVWEWCEDAWDEKAYQKRGGCVAEDPVVNAEMLGFKNPDRVIRGGSWGSDADWCRSAFRDWGRPDDRDINLGFRVCLVRSPAVLQKQEEKASAGRL